MLRISIGLALALGLGLGLSLGLALGFHLASRFGLLVLDLRLDSLHFA